jgi:succinate dehydrogenase flavoprotein subunit
VCGKRAGEFAAQFAKQSSLGEIHNDQIDSAAREALAPFERGDGENPYQIQKDLQELMQDNVGIVRTESEMQYALGQLQQLKERANRGAVTGNREYNPGWHTTIDLKNLLTVSEAITRAGIERKESRGAQFREDYPEKDDRFSKVNTIISRAPDGTMQVRLDRLPEIPEYLQQIIEEMK